MYLFYFWHICSLILNIPLLIKANLSCSQQNTPIDMLKISKIQITKINLGLHFSVVFNVIQFQTTKYNGFFFFVFLFFFFTTKLTSLFHHLM